MSKNNTGKGLQTLLLWQVVSFLVTVTCCLGHRLFQIGLKTPTIQWIFVYGVLWMTHSISLASFVTSSWCRFKRSLLWICARLGIPWRELPLSTTAQCAQIQRSNARAVAQAAARELFSWKIYICLALIDLESHYLITRAFRYTNIVSIQLLDCTAIPVVIVASVVLFGFKFRIRHILGSALCVVGIVGLVCTDAYLNMTSRGGVFRYRSDSLFGDLLVIGGAFLFAASDLVQELMLKTLSQFMESADARREVVSNLGFYGMFLALLQGFALQECHMFMRVVSANPKALYLEMALVAILIVFYSLVPRLLQRSSAATMNLSLLTSDFWSLAAASFFLGDTFHPLYFLGLCIVVAGIAAFHWKEIYLAFSATVHRYKAKKKKVKKLVKVHHQPLLSEEFEEVEEDDSSSETSDDTRIDVEVDDESSKLLRKNSTQSTYDSCNEA
jgi:drug/metabolite transporter (DMT)-like permease